MQLHFILKFYFSVAYKNDISVILKSISLPNIFDRAGDLLRRLQHSKIRSFGTKIFEDRSFEASNLRNFDTSIFEASKNQNYIIINLI